MVRIDETHAFFFEKLALRRLAAECIPCGKATVFEDHPMARRFHRLSVSA